MLKYVELRLLMDNSYYRIDGVVIVGIIFEFNWVGSFGKLWGWFVNLFIIGFLVLICIVFFLIFMFVISIDWKLFYVFIRCIFFVELNSFNLIVILKKI